MYFGPIFYKKVAIFKPSKTSFCSAKKYGSWIETTTKYRFNIQGLRVTFEQLSGSQYKVIPVCLANPQPKLALWQWSLIAPRWLKRLVYRLKWRLNSIKQTKAQGFFTATKAWLARVTPRLQRLIQGSRSTLSTLIRK